MRFPYLFVESAGCHTVGFSTCGDKAPNRKAGESIAGSFYCNKPVTIPPTALSAYAAHHIATQNKVRPTSWKGKAGSCASIDSEISHPDAANRNGRPNLGMASGSRAVDTLFPATASRWQRRPIPRKQKPSETRRHNASSLVPSIGRLSCAPHLFVPTARI